MSTLFVLFESSYGYALFEGIESEEVMDQNQKVQNSINEIGLFKKMVKLTAFFPFESAESALENCNDVSEGILNPTLKNFLQTYFPADNSNAKLGVSEEKLGSAIQEALSIECVKSTLVQELTRGIRLHFDKFIPELKSGDIEKAQLGLGHSYSRAKVKFNVNRVDNMIIQAISILDQLDKDVNTFTMRCREWYSWHFPELAKVVTDQLQFVRLAKAIGDKSSLTDDSVQVLTEITGDEVKSKEVLEAAKSSMGQDISEFDLLNIHHFADRVIELAAYRQHLHDYLVKKMHDVAPNLSTLIGEQVGARLISHAGSLTNLSKMPASTVQILGAEKALFRALKTKGNTPKYGLIYHSSFIGKANSKDKGRISRYLANKCVIASRIDNFSETTSTAFGEKMKDQVEERLRFYEQEGFVPRKNSDVMKEAVDQFNQEAAAKAEEERKQKKRDKKKKRKSASAVEETPMEVEQPVETPVTPSSEKKKKKKRDSAPAPVEEVVPEVTEAPSSGKKKRKSKGNN